MKKYLFIILILVFIYLFGLFSYRLARPLDEMSVQAIAVSMRRFEAGTSSVQVTDMASIKNINGLVAGDVLPGSKLYDAKIFGEKLRLYFAKTEQEAARLKVLFLNRRLAEAEILLENGKTGQAQQLVNQFAKGSENLMGELKKQDFLRTNPGLATEIEESISGQIDLQKKLMQTVGTSSPLYPLKERLLDLELQLADTPEEKKLVLEEQAKERQTKAITATDTRQARQAGDWQIIKTEIAPFNRNIRRYAQEKKQDLRYYWNLIRLESSRLIDKYQP